jgi:hypothetical protein
MTVALQWGSDKKKKVKKKKTCSKKLFIIIKLSERVNLKRMTKLNYIEIIFYLTT